ncbi:hypothetical protein [Cytobacillus gottheilii]|uniref:Uncharacterized protein n=1 Tax=Cytobacillus gottheilii TaxID=859144 RepID=A0ABX8F6Q9_9BACI|nr:hypothetical protein [Cytobacillus gottheilii]QVY60001.1 hypothetical protein J1899_13200 [Cytobacillus gottheilii]
MQNTLWYAILGIIGCIMIWCTYKKTDLRLYIALYIFTMGLAFFLDYFVLILFDAYAYHPNVFQDNWYDNTVGSSMSQALFIPSLLMLMVTFQMKLRMIVFLLFGVFLIEELFTMINIYEHYWWKSWYTFIILFISIYILKMWRNLLKQQIPFTRFLTIYMAITTCMQGLTIIIQAFWRTHHYTVGWFSELSRDSIAFNTAYWMIYSLLLAVIVLYCFSFSAFTILLVGDFSLNVILEKAGVLHINQYWHPVLFGICLILVLLMIKKLDDYLFSRILK